jgi:hypothetical protein
MNTDSKPVISSIWVEGELRGSKELDEKLR